MSRLFFQQTFSLQLLPGVRPNYAIKVTSVRKLLSYFTSGASAPYFGC